MSGLVHAVIDVSDGLVADLGHIRAAAAVGAVVEAGRVPLSSAARHALTTTPTLMARLLTGGDDYELVITAPSESADSLARIARDLELALTAIGRITEDRNARVQVVDERGKKLVLDRPGYRHF